MEKTLHPEYMENQLYWQKAEDVYKDRIKAKGKLYLPMGGSFPSSMCNGEISELMVFLEHRYITETLPMSVFYNFTNLTLNSVVGAIMRKPPTAKFGPDGADSILDYLIDNADGKGNGITQIARMTLTSQYLQSRGGILISTPELTNMKDLQEGKVVPRWAFYDAINIVDWETEHVDGIEKLTYLSLREITSKRNGSTREPVERFINYEIDDDGNVFFEIYEDDQLVDSDFQMKAGSPAKTIPFHLASSVNNDWCVDPSPARTLVDLNLQHYVMMSRDMQGRYDLGQLQLSIDVGSNPTSAEDFASLNPNGVMSGSIVPILTAGGSVNFLQANESNLLSKAPIEIEERAVKAGAQLFSDTGSNETATAAEIRSSNSTATMSSIASNCGDMIYNAIIETAEYISGDVIRVNPDDIEFSLNMEFFGGRLSAQEMQAYTQMVMQGVFPIRAMFDVLKSSGDLPEDKTYEDYLNDLREDFGAGGMPELEV